MRICRWNAHQEWLLVVPSDGALDVTLYVELDCQPSTNTVYSTGQYLKRTALRVLTKT